MSTARGLPIRVTLWCVFLGVVAVGGVAAEPVWPQERQIETERNESDNRLHIALRSDGSADVRMSYRTRLDDPNETAAFRQLRANARATPERYSERFAERMSEAAATAEVTTGREMAIENVSVRTTRPDSTVGVVTYTFTWRGFATTNGERLGVGDALEGFVLHDGSQVTIAWPDGYEPATIRPSPDDRRANAVVWTDSPAFEEDGPRVVVSASNTTTVGSSGDADPGGVIPNAVEDLPRGVAALVVVLVVVVVVFLVYRKSGTTTAETTGAAGSETAATVAPGSDSIDGGATSVDGGTADDTDATEPARDEPNDDAAKLLSNEEQVLRVLERHDGRMKQQQVVTALDWTEAKTSQVVSSLRAEDKVEGFRLGRENVLSLPEDPTGEAGSNGDNSG
ncbi:MULTISPECIES: DUF7345 domain-containing protein [Halococcus]|uniref:DUF4897 domain-containing protein n=1 Tax=Halococcus salifodinae DSM 8989 TaxID=1227456 RepID=M0NE95_9EURY|nr:MULTISPECIES: hypothetical protein [Halococcus]EMA55409.1 hypothetical protein C450_01544 [Halococcus salifodinae DSM 8989]